MRWCHSLYDVFHLRRNDKARSARRLNVVSIEIDSVIKRGFVLAMEYVNSCAKCHSVLVDGARFISGCLLSGTSSII